MTDNLPAISADRGDIALVGVDAIAALQSVMSGLNHADYDDINVTMHSESKPDGATRSVFSFRAYRHKR